VGIPGDRLWAFDNYLFAFPVDYLWALPAIICGHSVIICGLII